MEVQIFGTRKCKDTQKALRFFKERRVKVHMVDLDQRPASNLPSALREILDGVEGPVAERSFCLLRRLRVLPAR